MGELILLIGKSGSGKSMSLIPNEAAGIIGLDSKDTFIVSVTTKRLPGRNINVIFPRGESFSSGAKNIVTRDAKKIAQIIRTVDTEPKYAHIKTLVVEDVQYLQGFMYMSKIKEEGWGRFNDTGEAGFLPLQAAVTIQRDDLNIIFTYHAEMEDGEYRAKTAGKSMNNYITVEGLSNVVLFTKNEFNAGTGETDFFFLTQNDGINTGKTPFEMFDRKTERLIPNDMGFVLKRMKEFYG